MSFTFFREAIVWRNLLCTAQNGIWHVSTTRDGRGWIAEFGIPFKTLRFKQGKTDIGRINFERHHPALRRWHYSPRRQSLRKHAVPAGREAGQTQRPFERVAVVVITKGQVKNFLHRHFNSQNQRLSARNPDPIRSPGNSGRHRPSTARAQGRSERCCTRSPRAQPEAGRNNS